MKIKKVQMDTKVSPNVKNRLEDIAKILGVSRADVCRAAFNRYFAAFDSGLIKQEIPQDGKAK